MVRPVRIDKVTSKVSVEKLADAGQGHSQVDDSLSKICGKMTVEIHGTKTRGPPHMEGVHGGSYCDSKMLKTSTIWLFNTAMENHHF